MIIDVNRYTELQRRSDAVAETITSGDVNILQELSEHLQKTIFEMKDVDFFVECSDVLKNHWDINAMWVDLMETPNKIDLLNSQNIVFSPEERGVAFDPDSSELGAIIYSKSYTNVDNTPVTDFILMCSYYLPPGCEIYFFVSNNNGSDFYPILPAGEVSSTTALPEPGDTFVIKVQMTREIIGISPRLDGLALLFWDSKIHQTMTMVLPS